MPDNPAPGLFTANLPRVPMALQRTLESVRYDTEMNMLAGGQHLPKSRSVTEFRGTIMPVSDKDLRYDTEGAYTHESQKLYTEYAALSPGGVVRDPLSGQEYTVMQTLDHNVIHRLRRYVLEKKGEAAAK
jgi:hypothetical protein